MATGPGTSTWACSESPIGGPTWPSPPGAPNGTTALAGTSFSSTPTESLPTPNGPAITGCFGISAPNIRPTFMHISEKRPGVPPIIVEDPGLAVDLVYGNAPNQPRSPNPPQKPATEY